MAPKRKTLSTRFGPYFNPIPDPNTDKKDLTMNLILNINMLQDDIEIHEEAISNYIKLLEKNREELARKKTFLAQSAKELLKKKEIWVVNAEQLRTAVELFRGDHQRIQFYKHPVFCTGKDEKEVDDASIPYDLVVF